MARILQAFHSNPALGGFGNESSGLLSVNEGDCDAFAQIVKELVDNAVDACRDDSGIVRRIRVDFSQVSPAVLRVTVTDNGCGMESIQDCVEAFRSNKREGASADGNTAGRYGIGLTLCLLHAQRLVPNSTASITSATKECAGFQRRDYVVDTEGDCVKSIADEEIPKARPDESGTSISVLVPGGPMAHRAWPRLAEYFARFQLSLGLPCSLEVMAPTLSTVPLFVRSPLERRVPAVTTTDKEEWNPDMANSDSEDSACPVKDRKECDGRTEIQRAVSSFLKCNVDLKNVAHSIQPIRVPGKCRTKNSPTLEVDVIIFDKNQDEDDTDNNTGEHELPPAEMTLIRMVNRIPLLDGAEASACGLVQCVASKQSMWTSFGLAVMHGTDSTAQDLRLFSPTYAVRDTDSVASFFQNRSAHQLYEAEERDDESSDATDGDGGEQKPQKGKQKTLLLPAHLRLPKILLIVQIHAKPSLLPLPTLSKSRLPLNEAALDNAVEAGVVECLRSLQKTNPALLLTPKQLKTTIRDTRYIPAAAAAIACVLCKSKDKNFQKHFVRMIHGWSKPINLDDADNNNSEMENISSLLEVTKLGPLLEAKLRRLCAISDAGPTACKDTEHVTKRTTRSDANKENEVTPTTPPRRHSSWGGMSPSPAKTATQNKSTVHPRESMDSLTSGMSPSPIKIVRKATKKRERTLSMDSLNSALNDGIVATESNSGHLYGGGRILTPEEDDYDDEW